MSEPRPQATARFNTGFHAAISEVRKAMGTHIIASSITSRLMTAVLHSVLSDFNERIHGGGVGAASHVSPTADFRAGFHAAVTKLRSSMGAHISASSVTSGLMTAILDSVLHEFNAGKQVKDPGATAAKDVSDARTTPNTGPVPASSGPTSTTAKPNHTGGKRASEADTNPAAMSPLDPQQPASKRRRAEVVALESKDDGDLPSDDDFERLSDGHGGFPTIALGAPLANGTPNFIVGRLGTRIPNDGWGEIAVLLRIRDKQWPYNVAQGMFLNGEIAIDGRLARTVPRQDGPCAGCVKMGLDAVECKVREVWGEGSLRVTRCCMCLKRNTGCASM